jgi:hypothetical protein
MPKRLGERIGQKEKRYNILPAKDIQYKHLMNNKLIRR